MQCCVDLQRNSFDLAPPCVPVQRELDWRRTFHSARGASSLRSRDAKISASWTSSLSLGVTNPMALCSRTSV